jgi:hypothetical protein
MLQPNAYKRGPQYCDDMEKAMDWMLSARITNSIVAALDGRSKEIRRKLEDCVMKTVMDPQRHYDACISFRVPASGGDIRFQKRKIFGGFQNMLQIVGCLPCPRIRMKTQARGHFSACGETTTQATSYSDVVIRTLKSLPKASASDREAMTNTKLEVPENVVEAMGRTGYPLFWSEYLAVEWYKAWFKDLNVSHIFDITAGSSAAACASAELGLKYEGIAMNEKHANFLNNIMDKAVFAIVAGSEAESDKQIREDLQKYFLPLIEEGREFIVSEVMKDGAEEEYEEEDAANDD